MSQSSGPVDRAAEKRHGPAVFGDLYCSTEGYLMPLAGRRNHAVPLTSRRCVLTTEEVLTACATPSCSP